MEIISRLINEAASELSRAGVDSPRFSARLIMGLALGCSQEKILTHPNIVLSRAEADRFRKLVARRLEGEPFAYLAGRKEFFGHDFAVDRSVLIPRPETELLVELAIERYKSFHSPVFADIGTGSGVIAVTFALEMPSSRGLACDISMSALRLARINSLTHKVGDRVLFLCSDMGWAIRPRSLDFLVSNPPYLSESDLLAASFEITRHEPVQALVSPENGLWHIERLEKIAALLLKKGGMLFMEMGKDQGEKVADIFSQWKELTIHKDLAGHHRILSCVA